MLASSEEDFTLICIQHHRRTGLKNLGGADVSPTPMYAYVQQCTPMYNTQFILPLTHSHFWLPGNYKILAMIRCWRFQYF